MDSWAESMLANESLEHGGTEELGENIAYCSGYVSIVLIQLLHCGTVRE